jgi:gliding motility-associated-like protein
MKMTRLLLIFPITLCGLFAAGQPVNNTCTGAEQLCFGAPLSANNAGATPDSWTASCHSNDNTLWYKFTTNTKGGDVSVSVSAVCEGDAITGGSLVAAPAGCDTSAFVILDCVTSEQGSITLNGSDLEPGKRHFIVVNSQKGGQAVVCDWELNITGPGIEYSATPVVEHATCFQKKGTASIDDVVMGPGPYKYALKDSTPQSSSTFSGLHVGKQTVIITDAHGCKREEVFYIDGLDNYLSVDAGRDKTIIAGGMVQFYAEGNGSFYLWEPIEGLTDPDAQSTFASPKTTQTYAVYTYTNEHCRAADYITVFVLPAIVAPNAFTPNGDGVNDTWQIRFIDQYANAKVSIYNRWGQKVFQSTGYEQSQEWEGTARTGVALPTATYYYVIDLNSETDDREAEIFRGAVTIIR